MRVCLLAMNIYPMLSGDYASEKVGGAELQQINIAQSLAAQGHEVFVVCLDHGQPDAERIGRIVVLKTFRERAGLPWIRFFYPRLSAIWAALRRADADIYYCRTAGFQLGVLRMFRRLTGKPYVFAGALDTDFVPGLASIPNARDRFLYEYGLRSADRIIVQSAKQAELLAENYGLEGTVLPNFLNEGRRTLPRAARRSVLWVSTIRNRKRPLHFVRLAERFPDEHFVMVGGLIGSHRALYDEVAEASRRVPNLEFLGFQPFDRVERLFDECKVFVNTSLYEGFPNTFLQAWRRDIPVVSFVDPDGIIRGNSLGYVVDDETQLAAALRKALDSFDGYGRAGDYFLANHSAGVGERLSRLMEQTVASARAPGGSL